MFQRLLGKFVGGPMIFFAMVYRGSTVRVRGQLVKFSGSLV
jgi:hypothetical protein